MRRRTSVLRRGRAVDAGLGADRATGRALSAPGVAATSPPPCRSPTQGGAVDRSCGEIPPTIGGFLWPSGGAFVASDVRRERYAPVLCRFESQNADPAPETSLRFCRHNA